MELIIPPSATTDDARLRFAWHALQKWQRHQNDVVAALTAAEARRWHRDVSLPRLHAAVHAALRHRRLVYPAVPAGEAVPWDAAVQAIRLKATSDPDFAAIDLDLCFDGQALPDTGVDPTEDFTAYTELDPNSRFAIAASQIDADGLTRNEDAYVYADKGAGHFATPFEHDVAVTPQATDDTAVGVFWAVSNVVDDARYWYVNNSQAISAWLYRSSSLYTIRLRQHEPSAETDSYGNYTHATPYYCTAERTADTTMVLRIYSDASRTTLLDTLAVGVPSGRAYRYVFGANSYNSGDADAISFDVANLDLHEGAAAPCFPILGGRENVLGGLIVR